ncbi:ribonuclease H-like domain-containing protein [Flagelloscypha sp. PMI_526]|nr:ribonuclease H-like domain-containing protein [Flagelloscypha sp. PMI_526]
MVKTYWVLITNWLSSQYTYAGLACFLLASLAFFFSQHTLPSKLTISQVPQDEDVLPSPTKQPFDFFCVLDVEATCERLTEGFQYPNEIIEFPVCLMTWSDKQPDGTASKLEIIDEFSTYVKPTWRPKLSAFCTELTGITQDKVDRAPQFKQVLRDLKAWLIHPPAIKRFLWCSDGPFDIQDFVVKQCFISQVPLPEWIKKDALDVRAEVRKYLRKPRVRNKTIRNPQSHGNFVKLNIPGQLKALGLGEFAGRQHSGIDDTRNICRIVTKLAKQNVSLNPNFAIYPKKRWDWMGRNGAILEDRVPPPADQDS